MFAALSLTGTQLALIVLAAIAAAAAVAFFFRKDQEQEARRGKLRKLSEVFGTAKMPHVADILGKLSSGDYAGAFGEAIHLCRVIGGDVAALLKLLTPNFWWQVDERIKDPEQWRKLLEVIRQHQDALNAEAARVKNAVLEEAASLTMKGELAALQAERAVKPLGT